MQTKYGGYCSMCRDLSLEIVSYCNFTLDLYSEVKKLHKTSKGQQSAGDIESTRESN